MAITSFVDNINLSQAGRSKSVKHVERILIPRVYKNRGGYSVIESKECHEVRKN